MFTYRNAGGGGDDSGGCGDVEEIGADAAGAAGVDDIFWGVDREEVAAHNRCCAKEFGGGWFPGGEEGEEGGGVGRVGGAGHDLGEGVFGL